MSEWWRDTYRAEAGSSKRAKSGKRHFTSRKRGKDFSLGYLVSENIMSSRKNKTLILKKAHVHLIITVLALNLYIGRSILV